MGEIPTFMSKKISENPLCLLQAFRLNVGNLTTEYQYAAALKGFPLIKLRRTMSFAMICLPVRVNRKTVTGEGRQGAASGAELSVAESSKGSHNDTSAR